MPTHVWARAALPASRCQSADSCLNFSAELQPGTWGKRWSSETASFHLRHALLQEAWLRQQGKACFSGLCHGPMPSTTYVLAYMLQQCMAAHPPQVDTWHVRMPSYLVIALCPSCLRPGSAALVTARPALKYMCCMTAQQELHGDVLQFSEVFSYVVISIRRGRCGVFVSSDLLCPLAELPVLASHLAVKQASYRDVHGTESLRASHRVP